MEIFCFRNIKPCTRCVFVTVDPFKGEKDKKGQPLKLLRSIIWASFRYMLMKKINSIIVNCMPFYIKLCVCFCYVKLKRLAGYFTFRKSEGESVFYLIKEFSIISVYPKKGFKNVSLSTVRKNCRNIY